MTQEIHTTAVGQSAGVAAGRDIAASMRTEISAAAVAALVVACLVLSSSHMPLPALPWAAAFLFLAIQQDVRGMRIPNWLTLPSLVVAIGLGGVAGGLAGLGTALAGANANAVIHRKDENLAITGLAIWVASPSRLDGGNGGLHELFVDRNLQLHFGRAPARCRP